MKEALITGANGFIGQVLANALRFQGVKVRCMSRKKNAQMQFSCDFQTDQIPLDAVDGVDTIFHLAGYTHDNSNESQVKYLYQKINVEATVKLAELAIKYQVNTFVFISSVKAGGSAIPGHCSNEENQHEPQGIYGKTKREAELKLLEIEQKSNMHVSIVRSSLVYGPNVKGNLHQMLSGIEKGWFPPLPNTFNRRSMIHVDDLVRVLLLVAIEERAKGEIFIATDGKPHSSREVYKTMCNVLGKNIPRWSMPSFLFNILAWVSPTLRYKVNKLLGDEYYSSEKLHSLGFEAKFSLRDMNETSF